MGGIAATNEYVLVSDRDLADASDIFRCFDAHSGRELWTYPYSAPGKLDYGNSPRATPLIAGERVFFFGAFGHLSCVELATGHEIWQLDLRDEFEVTAKMPWGLCGSPLLIGDRLVVNPGGKTGSLVALNPATGDPVWESPGRAAGYGSFILAKLGGRLQLVGHDAATLGGWDLASGKRLWTVIPEYPGDFNVATPIVHAGRLVVSTENNGTRMFAFSSDGQIEPQPVAVCSELSPDTQTPVVVRDRLFGVSHDLFCLDLKNNLRVIWQGEDQAFQSHASLVATNDRLLVFTSTGELLLVDAAADKLKIVSRQLLFEDEVGLLSHPAFVGRRGYFRSSHEILCLSLAPW